MVIILKEIIIFHIINFDLKLLINEKIFDNELFNFFGSDEKKAFYEMSDRIIEIHDMLQDLKK